MKKSPYVSFVTCGRNDGYTTGYVRRVGRATLCLANQLEDAALDSEIIICEWNPPVGQPLLIDVLQLPTSYEHVSIRAIVVEARYHDCLIGSEARGIHVGEAINVGIRRARGRFVTAKASDSFFTRAVVEMVAQKNLDLDAMYRIDRHDVSITDDSIWDLDDNSLLARLAAMPSTPHALTPLSAIATGRRHVVSQGSPRVFMSLRSGQLTRPSTHLSMPFGGMIKRSSRMSSYVGSPIEQPQAIRCSRIIAMQISMTTIWRSRGSLMNLSKTGLEIKEPLSFGDLEEKVRSVDEQATA